MTIGEKLKEAREAQNITLDDLQESTKIQKRYLMAIEQGDFDLLPGIFYARAFIKEYALAVGLDANVLLKEHHNEIPETNEGLTEQYSRIQRSRRKSRPTTDTSVIFSLIPRLIVILLIVGIIFIAWTLIQKTLGDDQPNPSDEQESDAIIRPSKDSSDNSQDEEEAVEDDEESTDDEADEEVDETPSETISIEVDNLGTGNVPESTLTITHQSDNLLLSFTTDDRTWLDVTTQSGESLYRKELSTDESPVEFDITDHEEIRINAGNSPALAIQINDEPIEFPVDDRVHQKLILQLNKD